MSHYLRLEALRRPPESAQYTSIRYTERLDEFEVRPSVGSSGDSYALDDLPVLLQSR